jgi:hypothetical protein
VWLGNSVGVLPIWERLAVLEMGPVGPASPVLELGVWFLTGGHPHESVELSCGRSRNGCPGNRLGGREMLVNLRNRLWCSPQTLAG